MNTIHTSSLTHEIESYVSRADLLQFIQNRYEELALGGVWINRDVVGPFNKEQIIYMQLSKEDGRNDLTYINEEDRQRLASHLLTLSTYARFFRFAADFRKNEGYTVSYELRQVDGQEYIVLSMKDAAEFLSRKDYIDNWQSEMHETFCFWDFDEWSQQLGTAGFKIHPDSKAYTNDWIVQNRWLGKASIFSLQASQLVPIDYPITSMLLVGIKTL
jgi:hypothetical protein